MKFTLSWLKRHLDTNASLEEICDKLTAIGLEVEGLENRGQALAPFIIAQILEADQHPDADRLHVCKVDSGSGTLQVVCGAPNARAGLKTVLARPGDVIPRDGTALKKGVIRGVESQAMMCSASELQLSDEADGIIELPTDAPVGANYAQYAGLNDPTIEINLTPNRGDCAGVYGIARDLAAAGMGKLKPLDIKTHKGREKSRVGVKLDFPADKKDDCPVFVGRLVRNIKNGPSPQWLQHYLRSIGARPISALVDITNFLTFDCDRPFHVFDADKIKGDLRVYPAKGGEELLALNDKTYKLDAGMTVISDATGPLSLAGVMGGAASGCQADTVNVFIESALFSPLRVAQTGRALQISSDARYRFERGLDPQFVVPGAELATQLVLDLCGTPETVISELVIAGAVPDTSRSIAFDPALCEKRLGVAIAVEEQISTLTKLGFKVEKKGKQLSVHVPSWRPDVAETADLVEEVIRIKGFEHIPTTSMPRTTAVTETALSLADQRANQVRRALAGQGLMEAVTWSFMPGELAKEFGQIDPSLRLLNPISADLDVMRPSIFGNLLLAAKRNVDRGFGDVGLFEIGPVFCHATPDGQTIQATSLRAGQTPRSWATAQRPYDAFDAKTDVLAALAAVGAPVASLQTTADAPAWYHPGRSGCLRLGPTVLATFGELHPALVEAVGLTGAVVGCDVFLAEIPQPRSSGSAKPLLKLADLQPVSRDFAFVVDRAVPSDKIIKAIKGVDKKLISDVTVFDVYQGEHMAADKKSIALGVTLQPTERTLTDAELEGVAKRITDAVTKATGASLRG